MDKTHVKTHEKRQVRENKILKILPNNQIITTCCIKLRLQEMTMNEKLTTIGLTSIFNALELISNIKILEKLRSKCN